MNDKDLWWLILWGVAALAFFGLVGLAIEPDPPPSQPCFATTTGSSCDDLEVWEP